MISVSNKSYYLNVNLNNGLYKFVNESGTGKSYLRSVVIPQYRNAGYKFYAITYEADRSDIQYIDQIKSRLPLELLIVDRYDLYKTDLLSNFLADLSKDTIIIIDTKLGIGDIKCRSVDIIFKKDGFDIYDNAVRR